MNANSSLFPGSHAHSTLQEIQVVFGNQLASGQLVEKLNISLGIVGYKNVELHRNAPTSQFIVDIAIKLEDPCPYLKDHLVGRSEPGWNV